MANEPTKSTEGTTAIDAAEIRLSQAHYLFQAIIDTADFVLMGERPEAARPYLMSLARIGCDLTLLAQEELKATGTPDTRLEAA